MLVGGIDSICIVAAADTHLSAPVWLDEILTEGKYRAPYDGPQLWNDGFYNTIRKHTFKFQTGDTSKFTQLETWAEANTPVFLYTFGIDGGLQWEEGCVIRPDRDRANKSLDPDFLEVQIAVSGLGLNVRSRKNLLPSSVATGDTVTGFTIQSGTTFQSTTPNAGFSLATGNAFRLTQTTGYASGLATYNQKFPARKGHPISVWASYFGISGNDVGTPGIRLIGYNGSGSTTETFELINGIYSLENLIGTYIFSNANTRYFKLAFFSNEPGGGVNVINEFDSIALTYGPQISKFIDF